MFYSLRIGGCFLPREMGWDLAREDWGGSLLASDSWLCIVHPDFATFMGEGKERLATYVLMTGTSFRGLFRVLEIL